MNLRRAALLGSPPEAGGQLQCNWKFLFVFAIRFSNFAILFSVSLSPGLSVSVSPRLQEGGRRSFVRKNRLDSPVEPENDRKGLCHSVGRYVSSLRLYDVQ